MDAAEAAGILLAPPTDREPDAAYAALHEHGPLLRVSEPLYLVSGYDAVDRALRDPATETFDAERLQAVWPAWREYRAVALFANSMLRANPPHHTRQRRLAAGIFTARRVAALRETVAAQVDELLDRLTPVRRWGRSCRRSGLSPADLGDYRAARGSGRRPGSFSAARRGAHRRAGAALDRGGSGQSGRRGR